MPKCSLFLAVKFLLTQKGCRCAVKFVLRTSEVKFAHLAEGKTSHARKGKPSFCRCHSLK